MSTLFVAHPIVFAALLALVAAAHRIGARRRSGAVAWHPFPRWLDGLPIGARTTSPSCPHKGCRGACARAGRLATGPQKRY